MRLLRFVLVSLAITLMAQSQTPLAPADALAQLYRGYDAKAGTAQWICDANQQGHWQCSAENQTVQVGLMIEAEVWEGETAKLYMVSNAKPANYDCHSCEPAIGVAVFAWNGSQWDLESSNPAVGFYGAFGEPADVDVVKIGSEHEGVVVSGSFGGQGYVSSYKRLFVPIKKTVVEAWAIDDELDDDGAYDPTDKLGQHIHYRSAAGYRFDPTDDDDGKPREYWDIELISRGTDMNNKAITLQQQNWTERYRFVDGKYKLIKRTNFAEVRRQSKARR